VKPVVFHPAAEEEVEAAAARYDAERPGLGREFRAEFESTLQRMIDNPQIFGMEFGQFRACPMKRFPYTIFYINLDDCLWLSAVAHQSRRPGYWARRRPT
jgi:toxin ParE1/3/4